MNAFRRLTAISLLISLGAGCQMSRTGKGAAAGAVVGGVAGTVIGHQTGNDLIGAVAGTAGGAAVGGVLGHAADARAERDEARDSAEHFARQHETWNRAVPSSDVLTMAEKGLSDELIIDTLRDRGSGFDATPDNIVYAKKQGVSEPVIRAMQQYSVPYPPSHLAGDLSRDFIDD